MACADLFLLPSETESFGLAALEAMACGVPVVASRTGGLPEVIDDGESGFLLEVGNVEAMAEAGVRLLTDDDLHDAVSEAGRRAAETRFSAESVVPLYEAYYDRVLGG